MSESKQPHLNTQRLSDNPNRFNPADILDLPRFSPWTFPRGLSTAILIAPVGCLGATNRRNSQLRLPVRA